MNQRTIPWGTVLAGAIALGTAVLIGLSEVAGVSVPVRSAGPGAVIIVGILILAVGLVVVLRSGRADRAHTGHTAGAGGSAPGPVPPAPTDRDTAADSATTRTTVTPSVPVQSHPGPLDVTGPGSAEDTTGSATAAGDPAVQTPQSSH
jgi:hypothetical protein